VLMVLTETYPQVALAATDAEHAGRTHARVQRFVNAGGSMHERTRVAATIYTRWCAMCIVFSTAKTLAFSPATHMVESRAAIQHA